MYYEKEGSFGINTQDETLKFIDTLIELGHGRFHNVERMYISYTFSISCMD